MPNEEAKHWAEGNLTADFYERALQEAREEKERLQSLRKTIKPYQMPWENSRQGRIKHLVNDYIDARIPDVDAYIQELPPGGRSGKHRHMAEEIIHILEGRGYDIHWDPDVRMEDVFEWKLKEEGVKYEWKEGDTVYIPVMAAHQHFNADPGKPARFISARCRLYKHVGCPDLEQIEDAPDYKPPSG